MRCVRHLGGDLTAVIEALHVADRAERLKNLDNPPCPRRVRVALTNGLARPCGMSSPRLSRRSPAIALQTPEGLLSAIQAKGSTSASGLIPTRQIPVVWRGVAGMEAFCLAMVQATQHVAVAYKPNLAFFEQYGAEGWAALERVVERIPSDVLVIADAKRGDIGNTATRYARAMFEGLGADAVTVAPYMGRDSVEPFTAFEGRWTILLALTSNPGAEDFEFHGDRPLYREVLRKSQIRGRPKAHVRCGATRPAMLRECARRRLTPSYWFQALAPRAEPWKRLRRTA